MTPAILMQEQEPVEQVACGTSTGCVGIPWAGSVG